MDDYQAALELEAEAKEEAEAEAKGQDEQEQEKASEEEEAEEELEEKEEAGEHALDDEVVLSTQNDEADFILTHKFSLKTAWKTMTNSLLRWLARKILARVRRSAFARSPCQSGIKFLGPT